MNHKPKNHLVVAIIVMDSQFPLSFRKESNIKKNLRPYLIEKEYILQSFYVQNFH